MLKTCEVCQSDYEATRSNQKYCPDCAKNPDLSRRKLIAAEIRNKEHTGDRYRVREYICQVCGKKTLSTYNRTFCSNACLQEHIINTAKCPVCGALLVSRGRMTGKGCCSDECTEAQRLQVAKANGRYRACLQCGEMFIAPQDESKFCGVPCYRAWAAEQKQIKQSKPAPIVKRERACKSCGKIFDCTGTSRMYCSDECRVQKIKDGLKAAKQTRPDENICITCKTSQAQCERFLSKFQYLPTGAKQKQIKGKKVVISCPRYS